MTFNARDGFHKSSSVFNQPYLGPVGPVSGGIQEPNQSVIPPFANQLNNFGNVGVTYQFAANEMIGAGGTFSNSHYLDPAEVPGLFDSSSQGGSAFYAFRISKMHYVGVTYLYQQLLSYPVPGTTGPKRTRLFFSTHFMRRPDSRFPFLEARNTQTSARSSLTVYQSPTTPDPKAGTRKLGAA